MRAAVLLEQTLGRHWTILDVAPPQRDRKLPVVLSREDVWRVLRAVRTPAYRVCLTTIYSCGLRLREALALHVDQVDGGRMLLHVRRGKGGIDRLVPVPQALRHSRRIEFNWRFLSAASRGKNLYCVRPRHVSRLTHVSTQEPPMSPELDALDQLQGGDLPLGVVAALFPDEAHARRAIVAMLAAGELALLDPEGAPVSSWQLRELERQPSSWRVDTTHRLALTAVGARRIGG